jgi:Flp pilus assembly protein TadG
VVDRGEGVVARCFRHKTGRKERGAEAVEFALVVPVFLLLVFGVVDFGYMINHDTMVNNASREGARLGALDPDTTHITNTVIQDAGTLDTTKITVTVSCLNPPVAPASTGTPCVIAPGQNISTVAASGGTVIVKVGYPHSWITPVASICRLPAPMMLSRTTEMRIE